MQRRPSGRGADPADFDRLPQLFRPQARHRGGPVVLTGANGAGKTNLLEAISLLAPGRGLRGAAFEDLARIDGPGPPGPWRARSRARRHHRAGHGMGERCGAARQVRIAGEAHKSSGAFSDHLRILWLTPAMDRLFTGPASDRRRFLDRLVIAFDPEHGGRVIAFDKLMRDRNRVLCDHAPDPAWLGGLEHGMAEAAVAIAAARAAALDALQGFISEMPAARTPIGLPVGRLEIDGDLEARVRHSPAVQVEDEYRRLLRDSREATRRPGGASTGPIAATSWWCTAPRRRRRGSARPASRKPCSSVSCLPMPGRCAARATAGRRSCCSTRLPPTSTRSAGSACSRSSRSSACRPG
jgi:recombinational DNA repair ATPase RecF